MSTTNPDIEADIKAVGSIDAVSSILKVVCRTTKMRFAAVARVTDEKWVTCAVLDQIEFGLVPGSELKLETTICNEIRQHHAPVVIDHVAQDTIFRDHHTPAMYGFQSYISFPIHLKDGSFFGTLCAIDPAPNQLDNLQTREMFRLFAELIAFHLDAIERLETAENSLLEERKTAILRDQFIAILGHDLRNPVGAVMNASQILMRMPLDERTKRLATILHDSSYRMKGLIENVLDFARGRMGGGIVLNRKADEPMQKILSHVIDELNVIWPERVIDTEFDLTAAVDCDGTRIAQVLSNLLSNALTHGKKDQPVKVKVHTSAGAFLLSVSNGGKKIPDAAMARLFQPFSRGEIKPGEGGLGLGLYISSEIAHAHGGTLEVISTPDETCFTLKMPSAGSQIN